jgi:acetylornithine deacetylase/succinyl-diaminopimelate desuccinylase-like protein
MLDVVELTQRLVQASGLSGDERASADVAESAMAELGFREVLRDDYGSVIGLIGPAETDITALFDGHTDVVPATGEWSVDPYGGLIRDGHIFGRGSTDMKGGLAAAICGIANAAATAPLERQNSCVGLGDGGDN